jgi:hypothetical protein
MKTIDHAFCTRIGIDGVVMGTALCGCIQLCVVGLCSSCEMEMGRLCQGGLAYKSIVVRIDKLPRPCRLPFLDLCVQNGSPRDGCGRWFTCGFRYSTVRGHRRHIRLNIGVATSLWTIELGPQPSGLRWCIGSDVYTGMGDGPDRLAMASVSQFTDFRKFLRSETGHFCSLSLPRLRGRQPA